MACGAAVWRGDRWQEAQRSVRKAYVVLSRVLGYAIKARRLSVNPAVGVPLPKAMPADHVYLDDMQVDALANASGAYRVFILLLAYTGLRWGEASALKVGCVDLDACRAHIVEAYAGTTASSTSTRPRTTSAGRCRSRGSSPKS